MRILTASALALTLAFASPLNAQGLVPWGQVDGWDVLVDPTLDNGCLIQSEYDDGSVVRIGFDRSRGMGYLAAFNQSWGDIEDSATYPVLFDLDGEEYHGEATGVYLNGVPGAVILFTNPDFLFDIAARNVLTLYNESGEVMAIDLAGTDAGIAAAVECQDEMG